MPPGGMGRSGETAIPLLSLVLFGGLLFRTDTRALGYGVIVFLIVLFFASVVMTAGGWALGVRVARRLRGSATGEDAPLGSAWVWAYLLAVAAFLAVWPWR